MSAPHESFLIEFQPMWISLFLIVDSWRSDCPGPRASVYHRPTWSQKYIESRGVRQVRGTICLPSLIGLPQAASGRLIEFWFCCAVHGVLIFGDGCGESWPLMSAELLMDGSNSFGNFSHRGITLSDCYVVTHYRIWRLHVSDTVGSNSLLSSEIGSPILSMETRNTKLQIHHNAVAKHYMPYSRGISDSEDPEDLSTRTWLVSYPPNLPSCLLPSPSFSPIAPHHMKALMRTKGHAFSLDCKRWLI